MEERFVNKIGWFASIMAVIMYVSYIDQIRLNLSGHPGSVFLPLVTVINCSAWMAYGIFKIKRDWPLIVCNTPGIILGIVTAVTAFIVR